MNKFERYITKLSSKQWFEATLFLLILSLIQPILNGYHFGFSDHSIQLSIINKMMNPSLYPNDPMLETVKGYVSYYPRVIVFLNNIFSNREVLFFSFHIFFYFLFFGSIYLLAKQIFNHKAAIISVVLLAIPLFSLGGSRISFTSFYPVSFTLPFVIFALYQFYKNKYLISFLILGISINFHTLIAGHAFFLITSYHFWQLTQKEINWKKFLTSITVFLLFASPTLIWILNSSSEMSMQWVELLRLRSSHHSFPFSWKMNDYIEYGTFILIGLLSMVKFSVRNGSLDKTIIFFLAVFVLCFLGIIFSELIPIKFILKGQLFRSTIFLSILLIIYISNLIVNNWFGSTGNKIVSIFIYIVFLLPMKPSLLGAGFIILLIDIILSKTNLPENNQLIVPINRQRNISIALLLTIAPFLLYMFFGEIVGAINFVLKGNRGYFLVGCLILLFYIQNSTKTTRIHLLNKFIIMISLTVFIIIADYNFYSNYSEKKYWREIQLWAKENSHPTDLFITPPNLTGFRVFSERATLGEWKDGTQQYFDDDYSFIWWQRMQNLGYTKKGKNNFNTLTEVDFYKLYKKYGVNYLILPSKHNIDFTPIYQNKKFKAYKLSK